MSQLPDGFTQFNSRANLADGATAVVVMLTAIIMNRIKVRFILQFSKSRYPFHYEGNLDYSALSMHPTEYDRFLQRQ